jgi:hypothetical protein
MLSYFGETRKECAKVFGELEGNARGGLLSTRREMTPL